tara:strand:- start:1253 stop:1381 length:129 start_codon:yes stop_codon:yes gene_type:complete
MKTYTFSTTIGGNTTKEAWETFRDMLENEYKVWRAFKIKEKK